MTLYLLPNLLSPQADPEYAFVSALFGVINTLDGFFVENPKSARIYLKHFDFDVLKERPMMILNKETSNLQPLLKPLLKGERWGMIVDSGLPCIADPGSKLVHLAREHHISVIAFPGPSSLFLALMLSGIYSQTFVFQGYIPRDVNKNLRKEKRLQLFIETPYNTLKTLQKLIQVLNDDDLLCVASDLTLPTQEVKTQSIKLWKREDNVERFQRKLSIFLIKT